MKNALELIKEFCVSDFEKRDVDKTLRILSKQICWFGTSDGEEVHNLEEARSYIEQEIAQMPEPYGIRFISENVIFTGETSSTAILRLILTGAGIEYAVRVSASAGSEEGEEKLFVIHMSVSANEQQEGEFFPVKVAEQTIQKLQKQLQASMEEQQQTQQALDVSVRAMTGGIVTYCMREGRFQPMYVSEGMAVLTGWSVEELIRATAEHGLMATIFEPDREFVMREVEQVIAQRSHTDITFRVPRKDGQSTWINAAVSYQGQEEGGIILGAVFTGLGKQAILYQELLDDSASGIYVCDRKTHELLYANQSAFSMMGKKMVEYWGKTCHACMVGSDTPCDFCMEKHFVRDELRFGELVIPEYGKTFDVTGKIIDFNGREALLQYVVDTTEKKKMMQELRESAAMLNTSLESSRLQYRHELQVRDSLLQEAVVFYQLNLTSQILENKKSFFRSQGVQEHRIRSRRWSGSGHFRRLSIRAITRTSDGCLRYRR